MAGRFPFEAGLTAELAGAEESRVDIDPQNVGVNRLSTSWAKGGNAADSFYRSKIRDGDDVVREEVAGANEGEMLKTKKAATTTGRALLSMRYQQYAQ
jgi:hypothetical protein